MSFDALKAAAVKPEGMVPTNNDDEPCPPLPEADGFLGNKLNSLESAKHENECEKFKMEHFLDTLRAAADAWNEGSDTGKKVAVRLIQDSSLGNSLEVLGNFARFAAEIPEKAKHLLGIDKK